MKQDKDQVLSHNIRICSPSPKWTTRAAAVLGIKGEFCERCAFKEFTPPAGSERSFFQQSPQVSFDLVQHVI